MTESLSLFSEYNVTELQNDGFSVCANRFGRIPARFLAFSGKNSLFLTEKAGKTQKKDKKDPPLTGSPSSRVLGGFDGGIEVGWYGDWSKDSFESFCSVFDRCRSAADQKDFYNSYCRVGRYVVQLAPTGAVVGRLKYKYVLLYHGLRIYIHGNPSGNIQPIRVKIGAVPLMRHGLQRVYQIIIDILFSLGFQPMEELVSRADCQIMSSDCSVQDFFESLSGGRFVTLSRGKLSLVASLQTGKLESVTVHSRNVELCVYDKLAELTTCEPAYQETFLQTYAPTGKLPPTLTRFEFRFRSEILRNFAIKTVSDLFCSAASLLRWASSAWFRVIKSKKTRGYENKAKVSDLWEKVQIAFHKVFSCFGSRTVQRVKILFRASSERVQRLARQAVGCLGSAVALLAGSFSEAKEDFYSLTVGLIDKHFSDLRNKVQSRAVELALVDGYYNKE